MDYTDDDWVERMLEIINKQVDQPLIDTPSIGSLWVSKLTARRGRIVNATLHWVVLCFNESTGATVTHSLDKFLELYQEV
jgi:hypothetical protein